MRTRAAVGPKVLEDLDAVSGVAPPRRERVLDRIGHNNRPRSAKAQVSRTCGSVARRPPSSIVGTVGQWNPARSYSGEEGVRPRRTTFSGLGGVSCLSHGPDRTSPVRTIQIRVTFTCI